MNINISELFESINGLYDDGTPKTTVGVSTLTYEENGDISDLKTFPLRDVETEISFTSPTHLRLKLMFRTSNDINLGKLNEEGQSYEEKVNAFLINPDADLKQPGLWVLITPFEMGGRINVMLKNPVGIFLTSKKPNNPAKTLNMIFDISNIEEEDSNFVIFEKETEEGERVIHDFEERF